jgi:4-amino-4-deoxy-L-arabinose transferase-like glycosyltransferase
VPRLALAAFAGAILSLVGFKVAGNIVLGPAWDGYAFLANAAEWAGRGFGYGEPHRPPFISWVASIPMRLGLMDAWVIQVADGLLSLVAVAAFYLVLRRRFSGPVAVGGATALLVGQIPWLWLGTGYTDLPSVGLGLVALLCLIKATEENDRWYWAVGAAFAAAVLTRYTALFVAFPLLVWLVLRWRPFAHAGRVGQAALVGLAVYAPAAVFYLRRFGDVMFPFLMAASMVESVSTEGGEATIASDGGWWYLRKLPSLLGPSGVEPLTWLIILLAVWGLAGAAWAFLRANRPTAWRAFGVLLAVSLPVTAELVGAGVGTRPVTITLGLLGVWWILGRMPDADGRRRVPAPLALDATLLTWFLVYFDFHGHQLVQVARYVIPMAPGVIYLVLLGWSSLAQDAALPAVGRSTFLGRAAQVPLAAWLIIAIASSVVATPAERSSTVLAAQDTAEWIRESGGLEEGVVVLSDQWPHTAWYLKHPVRPMPAFEDDKAFGHELDKTGAKYYVTYRNLPIEGYDVAFSTAPAGNESVGFRVLAGGGRTTADLPSVQHLGTAWPSYVESLVDYRMQLHYTAGLESQYGWEGSAFLDAFSAEELAENDAVFVYGVRWRDRGDGEDALREYVTNGGTAVIDASSNLGGMWYSLRDVTMYDTVIRAGALPATAEVDLDPGFLARNPELRDGTTFKFVAEGGGPWTGAAYTALDATEKRTVLVKLAGQPAVTQQNLGRGRILWIGYNLVWHAYFAGDTEERALMRALLEEAVQPPPPAAP